MAQQTLDQNENESPETFIGRLNAMFTELYTSFGGATNPSVTTVTTSGNATIGGALSAASAAIAGAISGVTTLVASGLATVQSLKLDTGTKTVTASAGAATLNKSSGIVTSESLTTAAGSDYTLTLTNSSIAAGDVALVSVDSNGSTGFPVLYSSKTTSNTLTVIVRNAHASVAFNAAIKIAFAVLKA